MGLGVSLTLYLQWCCVVRSPYERLHRLIVSCFVVFDCCLFKACFVSEGTQWSDSGGNGGAELEHGEKDAVRMYCIREAYFFF